MEKAKTFVCGCLNGDKKGIIYFGVGDSVDQTSPHKRGEILGLDVESSMDDIVKSFQCVLDDHLRSDDGALQKGDEQDCIRLEFVPVTEGEHRTCLYVVEIEVAREWSVCKDRVYYSKYWVEKRGTGSDSKSKQRKGLHDFYKVQQDDFRAVIRTNGASQPVKSYDLIKHVKQPLVTKFEEWQQKKHVPGKICSKNNS